MLPEEPHRKSQTDGNNRSSREHIIIFHMAYGVGLIKVVLVSRNELTSSHKRITSSFMTFIAVQDITNQHTMWQE